MKYSSSHRFIRKKTKSIPITFLIVASLCLISFFIGIQCKSILFFSSTVTTTSPTLLTTTTASTDIKTKTNNNKNDFYLASTQSFNFFNDIPTHQWHIHQKIYNSYSSHKNPLDPLEYVPGHSKRKMSYFNSPQAFYQTNYEPNFSCAFERRVGGNGNGDGPKWVCDPHRIERLATERLERQKQQRQTYKSDGDGGAGCLVYSIGSNGDFQFEVGLQNILSSIDVCEIHIFDMGDYEDKMPKGLNLHYHKWGLIKDNNHSNSSSESVIEKGKEYYSLEETIKLLGHDNRDTIDIFKIDCDKCEWRTWKDWFGPNIPMLQQILVETHSSPKDFVLPFFDGLMEEKGYVMFHKEPNIQFGGGEAVEFGFLKLHNDFFATKRNEEQKKEGY